MIRILLRAVGLLGIYLLVLASTKPGDIALGALLALGVAAWLRPREGGTREVRVPEQVGAGERLAAAVGLAWDLTRAVVSGTWRTARFCLGGEAAPGLVEIPRGNRSPGGIALWGIVTGDSPDEIPVDVDDERDALIVHVLDSDDPEWVRRRHDEAHERRVRKVAP